MDLSAIDIIEKEERCLVTVDIDKDTSFYEEVEMITAETEKYKLGRLHDALYGSMISVCRNERPKSVLNKNPVMASAIFLSASS